MRTQRKFRVGTVSRFLTAASATMLTTLLVPQVSAQETPAAPANRAESDRESSDNAIVVTARKREEALSNVPVSVEVLSGSALQEANITQLIDIASVTPNFQYTYGAVQPFLFVRGFGSGNAATFEQSVGKFIDNVSYGRGQDGRIPIFDVERVELLRGPQVLTFGNSATVGALNVTSRRPGDEFEADGSLAYEFNQREINIQGGVTVPLADWASFRLGGLFQNSEKGQLYNPLKDAFEPTVRNWAFRPSLRLTPAEGLEIVLRAEKYDLLDDGNPTQVLTQPLATNRLPFDEVDNPDQRNATFDVAPFFTDEFSALKGDMYGAEINFDVLGGTLTSTTAQRNVRSDVQFGVGGPNASQPYFNALWEDYEQFSQELRFFGSYGALDVGGGLYYQEDDLDVAIIQEFQLGSYGGFSGAITTPFGRVAYLNQKAKTRSAFIDLTYRVTDAFSIAAGVRYSNIKKRAGQGIFATGIVPSLDFNTSLDDLRAQENPALNGLVNALGTLPHDFSYGTLSLRNRYWQPQVILQYDFDDDTMIYAKYVKGAKAGGFDYLYFTDTNPDAARFRPEKAQSFEAGIRGEVRSLANLTYSITGFRTTFTDLQASVLSDLRLVISNVGKARSQGFETEFAIRPAVGLRLSGSLTYLDSRILDFPRAPCGSVANFETPSGCVADLSDTPTQYASKWTGMFSADYTTPVFGGEYELGGGISVMARSKFNAGAYNDPQMVQPGYATIDAHLDLGRSDGAWTLSLFGRNLTDKRALNYAVLTAGNGTSTLGSYSRERQIGLRLGFRIP